MTYDRRISNLTCVYLCLFVYYISIFISFLLLIPSCIQVILSEKRLSAGLFRSVTVL